MQSNLEFYVPKSKIFECCGLFLIDLHVDIYPLQIKEILIKLSAIILMQILV